tara:strand:- start:117 stop:713 length:597 start_codon:yes stop_codon:yes gene_type:complete
VAAITTTWTLNAAITELWNNYLFVIADAAVLANLQKGQGVTSITYANPAATPGVGGNKILSLVYRSASNKVRFSDAPGFTLTGVLVIDAAGTLVKPFNAGNNNGNIVFNDPTLTVDQINKQCFDKVVWNKQCEYSKDVLAYLNRILFGYISSHSKIECLKNKKRTLEILHAYDTRDIANNTTVYNTLTYTQIKKLLDS